MTILLLAFATGAMGVPLLDTYYSPKNRERPMRPSTQFIILHTTEGGAKGSGEKLARYGEAHYMVDKAGRIYRIIDRRRVAYHCGRSMWDGRTSLDKYSIGIEMVGNHNQDLTAAQYRALRQLIAELKRIYRVPDTRILTHSMVAYGTPNRWHTRSHRGRKRCGMRMAIGSVRQQLGISRKPSFDPDVRAGRLIIADPTLHKILYSQDKQEQKSAIAAFSATDSDVIGAGRTAWDVARDAYNSPETVYIMPNGTRRKGSEITNWKAIPPGTRVVLSGGDENPVESVRVLKRGQSPASVAGAEWKSRTTVYIMPSGKYLLGNELTEVAAQSLPPQTRILVGYKVMGPITSRRRAFDLCGPNWNQADTYYLFPDGTLESGNKIDPARIPAGTHAIFKE